MKTEELKSTYYDIFQTVEGCRREGEKGRKDGETETKTHYDKISKAMLSFVKELESQDNDEWRGLFAGALTKYASYFDSQFSIYEPHQTFRDEIIESFLKKCKDVLMHAKDVFFKCIDRKSLDTANNVLDKMRELCFIFCLTAQETVASGASIVTLINKAIIFDAMKNSIALRAICNEINNLVINNVGKIIHIEDKDLLWECGTLNYKICQYTCAIEYFKKYIEVNMQMQQRETCGEEILKRSGRDILDALYKIAFCHEFSGNIPQALYIFTCLFKKFEPEKYSTLRLPEFETIKLHINYDEKDKAFYDDYVNDINRFVSHANFPTDLELDTNNTAGIKSVEEDVKNNAELVHGIAHLFNELVLFYKQSKKIPKEYVQLAQCLMYNAVCKNDAYLSCLGTTLSENEEFDEAIEIFNFILNDGIFSDRYHLKQEVVFYLAHAYLFSNKYDDALACLSEFAQYCHDYNDKDGFSHYALYEVYCTLRKQNDILSMDAKTIMLLINKLENNKPSLYCTVTVHKEWHRLKHFLFALIAVKELTEANSFRPQSIADAMEHLMRCSERPLRRKVGTAKFGEEEKEINFLCFVEENDNDHPIIFFNDDDLIDEKTETSFVPFVRDKSATKKSFGKYVRPIIVYASDDHQRLRNILEEFTQNGIRLFALDDVFGKIAGEIKSQVTFISIPDKSKEALLRYACIVFSFEKEVENLFKTKEFLGLSPTKMTQLYKFNVRKKIGLHLETVCIRSAATKSYSDAFQNAFLQAKKPSLLMDKHYDNRIKGLFDTLKTEDGIKLLATIYVPQKLGIISYRISDKLLLAGLDKYELKKTYENRIAKKKISLNNLYLALNNRIVEKYGCSPDYRCEWSSESCGHALINRDSFNGILEELFPSITFLGYNNKMVKSILAIRLTNADYVLLLLKEELEEIFSSELSRKIIRFIYNDLKNRHQEAQTTLNDTYPYRVKPLSNLSITKEEIGKIVYALKELRKTCTSMMDTKFAANKTGTIKRLTKEVQILWGIGERIEGMIQKYDGRDSPYDKTADDIWIEINYLKTEVENVK